jgi:uncharacterized protein (DUF983 family)
MTIKCPHCKEGKIFKDADGSYFCINCGLRKEPEQVSVYPIRKEGYFRKLMAGGVK